MRTKIFTYLITTSFVTVALSFWNSSFWLAAGISLFLLGWALWDGSQKRHTIMVNYPIFGRFRYWMEELRPKIYQYFIESDTDGAPINRLTRSVVYQRAKKELDTSPFGTQHDVYEVGYEWMKHSMFPKEVTKDVDSWRKVVGGKDCKQPYNASILNISAMSFGALSKNAIMALNTGAKLGGFAHNTGEGGLSPYHLQPGGDIIWQIGTGYFGCRTKDGRFEPSHFKEKAAYPQVKMIEIKLSQGAKPGHGGILPAAKNSPEIAAIRGVEPYTTVFSPPYHREFNNAGEMLDFVAKVRELSDGKPIGLKMCLGKESEFTELCKAMLRQGIYPDFLTIDGGEGGTGAAPLEFSNSMGTPLRDALVFVINELMRYDLRQKISVISSGKIFTGFHVARTLALGADMCNSARAMMLALGCIQALVCNSNKCPTGVATQDPKLYKGLDVASKGVRIHNFHHETLHAFGELLAAAGHSKPSDLKREHIMRRVSPQKTLSYAEIYPLYSDSNMEGLQFKAIG